MDVFFGCESSVKYVFRQANQLDTELPAWRMCHLKAVNRSLTITEWYVHRRGAVEVDLFDVGPRHVLGVLKTIDEDE